MIPSRNEQALMRFLQEFRLLPRPHQAEICGLVREMVWTKRREGVPEEKFFRALERCLLGLCASG